MSSASRGGTHRLVGVSIPDAVPDVGITDDELTALALAAQPNPVIPEDAVPIGVQLSHLGAPLPLWYMPPVIRSAGDGRHRSFWQWSLRFS